jgi:hypothetical protein
MVRAHSRGASYFAKQRRKQNLSFVLECRLNEGLSMRKLVGLAIAASAVAVLGYFVLVKDGFAPSTELSGYFALAAEYRLDLSGLDRLNGAAKAKHGPTVATAIRGVDGGGNWEAHVDGAVVESRRLRAMPSTVFGVFAVEERTTVRRRFPFVLLGTGQTFTDPETVTDKIKRRFKGEVPPAVLAFEDRDWNIVGCAQRDAHLGSRIAEAMVRIDASDVCLVDAAGSAQRLLVGYAVAKGGWWIRPFAGRICRALSSSWVDAMTKTAGAKIPSYAACLLNDHPGSAATDVGTVMSAHFFEVRPDRSLAIFR